jgi:hypothetical protein
MDDSLAGYPRVVSVASFASFAAHAVIVGLKQSDAGRFAVFLPRDFGLWFLIHTFGSPSLLFYALFKTEQ